MPKERIHTVSHIPDIVDHYKIIHYHTSYELKQSITISLSVLLDKGIISVLAEKIREIKMEFIEILLESTSHSISEGREEIL